MGKAEQEEGDGADPELAVADVSVMAQLEVGTGQGVQVDVASTKRGCVTRKPGSLRALDLRTNILQGAIVIVKPLYETLNIKSCHMQRNSTLIVLT